MALGKDNVIRVSKRFEVPVRELYELCADEDFFDFCGVDIDSGEYEFAVDGEYSYVVDDDDFVKGRFRAIEPEKKIEFTWLTQGLDGPTGETVVTLEFTGDPARSELTLVHAGLTHRPTAKAHDEAWIEILEAIAEELSDKSR